MPMAARTRPTKSRKRRSWCSQADSRKSKPWRNVWKRCDRYAMSRHIYFVLTPGFLLLDFAGPAEAFMYARRAGADFTLHFVGADTALPGALGLSLAPLEPLPDALPADAVVVLSGSTRPHENYRTREAQAVIAWLG